MSIVESQVTLASISSQYQMLQFVFKQLLSGTMTAALVQVKSVTNTGTDTAVGYVDVTPMLNQLGANNQTVAHGVIYSLPYFRLQGGANAIILDPQVGDIGCAVFCYRDISALVALNKANPGSLNGAGAVNPATGAMYDWGSGLYLGGFMNGTPSQYVQFAPSGAGITLVSPQKITLQAPEIDINGSTKVVITTAETDINSSSKVSITSPEVDASGEIIATGEVTGNGIALSTHTHSGVTTGSGDTGPPV